MATHYEDFAVGDTWTVGTRRVTASEIREFARQYDPQPMHLEDDPETNPFGGLIASGWHTAALTMRLLVDDLFEDVAARGGLGVDELRWPNPLRPGAELEADVEVVARESFDEDRGRVDFRVTTSDGDGDIVLSMVVKGLFGRRDTG